MDNEKWHFLPYDIITAFFPGHKWYGKRVTVNLIRDGRLWGTVIGRDFSNEVDSPKGLTLVRRPGLNFCSRDEIIVQNPKQLGIGSGLSGLKVGSRGRIIVINPEKGADLPFLAEFDGLESGHDGSLLWSGSWFPREYKECCRNRLWINGNGVERYIP